MGACLLLAVVPAPAASQSRPYGNTALLRAVDMLEVQGVCAPAAVDCDTANTRAVMAFLASLDRPPLEPLPTPDQIDAARRDARAAETAAALPTTYGGGAPNAALTTPLTFSSAAFAVADFLAMRAKAELAQSALRDLAALIQDGDLATLFPHAGAVLQGVDEISYRTLMPTARAALIEDLRALPRTLSSDLDIYGDAGAPDEVRLLSMVADAALRIEGGEDALHVLSDPFGLEATWNDAALQSGLQFTVRFVGEYRAGSSIQGPAGFNGSLLDYVLADLGRARVFVSVLAIDLGMGSRIPTLLAAEFDELTALIESLDALRTTVRPPAGMMGQMPARPEASEIVSASVSVVRAAVPFLTNDADERAVLRDEIDTAHQLWRAAHTRDYARVVVLASNRLIEATKVGSPPNRVLAFAASVASAEDADALTEALEAFVDPVGSFRARRAQGSGPSFALVSYLGLSGGVEEVGDLDGVAFGGAFAPVGLELSLPFKPFSGSVGLLLSPIDLGTLVSYRLEEAEPGSAGEGEAGDNVDDTPDVNLHHIFSPSASLVFGISQRYPLSVGFGVQRAPELRSLEDGSARVSAWRYSAFIGVDLTLFRF